MRAWVDGLVCHGGGLFPGHQGPPKVSIINVLFPEPDTPHTPSEHTQRQRDGFPCRLLARAPTIFIHPCGCRRGLRKWILTVAAQPACRDGFRASHLFRRTLRHHLPTQVTCSRSHIHQVVCRADHLQIMLDQDNRIAFIRRSLAGLRSGHPPPLDAGRVSVHPTVRSAKSARCPAGWPAARAAPLRLRACLLSRSRCR